MNPSFPTISPEFYLAASPILILCIGALIALLQSVSKSLSSVTAVFSTTIVSIVLAIAGLLATSSLPATSFISGSLVSGSTSFFGQGLVLLVALITGLFFKDSFLKSKFFRGEIASIYLMVVTGLLVLATTDDLVTLFTGLELSSIGLYALVGYINPTRHSQEGAIKYFVLGSFAAALLLFGFALLYASTGSLQISEIVNLSRTLSDHAWIKLGTVFVISGLGFKLALAPFHLWTPDTYESAPTSLTAFMATAGKVVILIVTLRLVSFGLTASAEVWQPGLLFMAAFSMILGNVMALVQTSVKRMLAYSSVAHSGYMTVALAATAGESGSFPVSAALFYIVGYILVTLGAFACLVSLETEGKENLRLDDLSGLASRHPWTAFALAAFMFSFAGMPPTVGFMGKFFVFNAAITNHLIGIVIIGAIGSAISLYYYLRLIVKMYMSPALPVHEKGGRSLILTAIVVVTLILNIALGTFATAPGLDSVGQAAKNLASNLK